ncbi:MAG: thioesterase family protein [Bacteroidota bacterium]|jgi:fluoroacetyl-CoA thioesterase
MKAPFKPGDKKTFVKQVTAADTAAFESGAVHPVYATFALGRDAEWVCRLFVLDMKDGDEEGIGTFLYINHHSPALLGQEVLFTATYKDLIENQLICTFEANISGRLIASGETGQKILKKVKLETIFNQYL